MNDCIDSPNLRDLRLPKREQNPTTTTASNNSRDAYNQNKLSNSVGCIESKAFDKIQLLEVINTKNRARRICTFGVLKANLIFSSRSKFIRSLPHKSDHQSSFVTQLMSCSFARDWQTNRLAWIWEDCDNPEKTEFGFAYLYQPPKIEL